MASEHRSKLSFVIALTIILGSAWVGWWRGQRQDAPIDGRSIAPVASVVVAQRPMALGTGTRAHDDLRGLCAAVLAALPSVGRRQPPMNVTQVRLRPEAMV